MSAAASARAKAESFAAQIKAALVEVEALLPTSKGDADNDGREPLLAIDAADLLGRSFDKPRWLVEGLITRGGIAMIGAEPKAAKTWLALEIAVAIATGTKVCGEFRVDHGRAAYFFAEDLDVQVRNRVRALLAGADRQLEPGRLFLQPRGAFIDVMRNEDLAWLVASCRRLPALDFVALDPLRDIHSGEEDKSDSMRDVMRRTRVIEQLVAAVPGVVHHAPKSTKENASRRPGQNLRGSSAIHGAVDSGLYLEQPGGDGTNVFASTLISQVKGARSAGRFKLELRVEDDADGEAVRASWTVSRFEAKTGASQLSPEETDEIAVLAWVRELAIQGVRMTTTDLRVRKDRPIAEKKVTAAIKRMVDDGRLVLHLGVVLLPGQVPS